MIVRERAKHRINKDPSETTQMYGFMSILGDIVLLGLAIAVLFLLTRSIWWQN